MRHWPVHYLKIFILALVFFPACFPGFAGAVPSPCDQLDRRDYQEICARFLADTESSGGHTFAIADTARGFDEFKSKLEDDKNYAGLILLLTDDIDIVGKAGRVVYPRGIVALIGNPDNPPRINLIGKKGEISTVVLAPDPKTGATIKPQAFYCWGIAWVLGDIVRNVVYVVEHYGPVHITHSIFGYTTPIKFFYSVSPYIDISLEYAPDRTVNNSILIAHNRFTNVPAEHLGKLEKRFDIYIHCILIKDSKDKQLASTCQQLGAVVITDNTWQSPPELSAEPFNTEEVRAEPSPYGPSPYRASVFLENISKLTFSGNRAADPDAVLSVLVMCSYPDDVSEAAVFNHIDLQLVNNMAEPEMNATHRQFYLNGLLTYSRDWPVKGLVNMTCNPDFDVVRTGSFAHDSQHNLTIIQANDNCTGPTVVPITVPTPVTSTVSPASMITAVLTSETSPYATATVSVSSVLPSITSASPAPSHAASPGGGTADNIIIYSAGAAGLVLALTAWEAIWITAYRHSTGNFQTFAGVMALFIPFCLHKLLLRGDTPFQRLVDMDD